MLDFNQLPQHVQKQIEKVAADLNILEQTALNRTSYKKEFEGGITISKPKTEKIRPSYTIAYCKNEQWNTQVQKHKNIDHFQSLILEIIESFEPDFIRVMTFKNDCRDPQKAGRQTHTIVLNELAEVPKEDLKVIPIEETKTHTEDFDALDNYRSIQLLIDKYDKARTEQELGKVEAVKSEMGLQMQLLGLKSENEMGLFKIEMNNQLALLRRDYTDKVKEVEQLKEKIKVLCEELDESEEDNEVLQETIKDLQAQLDALNIEISRRESAEVKTQKMVSAGGSILGLALQGLTIKNPKFKKALDGLMGAFGGEDVEEEPAPSKKDGGARLSTEPPSAEDNHKQILCTWINEIDNLEALQVLLGMANGLSSGQITLQQIFDLSKPKGGENGKV